MREVPRTTHTPRTSFISRFGSDAFELRRELIAGALAMGGNFTQLEVGEYDGDHTGRGQQPQRFRNTGSRPGEFYTRR